MPNAQPQDSGVGSRLYYEIIETAVGSKSQGWHGVLYDTNGQPKVVAPGTMFDPVKDTGALPCGKFVGIKKGLPWAPYGAIPEVMIGEHGIDNHPLNEEWSYKLVVWAEGTKAAGTRGELHCGGKLVEPDKGGHEITTAMGKFGWKDNDQPFGVHGWYPMKS